MGVNRSLAPNILKLTASVIYNIYFLNQVTVEIRTSIISVGDIDTVGQQFKCDFYLSATWQEPQLQGRRTEVRLHVYLSGSDKGRAAWIILHNKSITRESR